MKSGGSRCRLRWWGKPKAPAGSVYVPPVVIPPIEPTPITLGALGLTPTAVNEDAAYSGTITGRTVGSTLTATSSDGTVLSVVGTTVTGTFTNPGTPTVTVSEVKAGATNTPRLSDFEFAINDVVEGGAATLDTALTPPILALVSSNPDGTSPVLDADLDDTAAVGDTLRVYQRTKAGSLVNTFSHVITLAEATDTSGGTDGKVTLDFGAVAAGSWRFTCDYLKQGGATYSNLSNAVRNGPDDQEPALSLPITNNLFATFGEIGGTTDEANGTMYAVVPLSGGQPSKAQIKAGQNAAGTALAVGLKGTLAITTVGAKTFAFSGTSASTSYTAYIMHEDATGNQSAVLPVPFITEAADASVWDPTSISANITLSNANRDAICNNSGSSTTFTGTQARSTGKRWVEYECYFTPGTTAYPGLIDTGSAELIYFRPNADSNTSPTWTVPWSPSTPTKIMFVVDFIARTIDGYINGTSASQVPMPVGMVNARPQSRLGDGAGVYSKINTGQETPMGGVPTGATAWG